nr:hypothetical protein [uncultured Achromobacter sp.]
MSTIKLPPLPDLQYKIFYRSEVLAELTAYAEEAVRQALESAAAIADRQHFGGGRDDEMSWTDCAALIAAEIRSLIPENDHGEST